MVLAYWHEMGRALNGTDMKWDGHELGQARIRTVGHEMGWT